MRLLVLVGSLGVLACGDATDGGPAIPSGRGPGHVLLVTIDTLRADHLGIYGYHRDTSPQIDRWFGEGAVYERGYSPEASTSPSVVSILSGQLPQDHRVRLFYQLMPEEVQLIPDLLPPAYESAAVVSNMVLTDEAIGIGGRFDHYDDFVDERESKRKIFERPAERTTESALRWLATERTEGRPFFLWVHYIDPHGPYRPPDGWQRSFEPDEEHIIPKDKIPGYVREEGVRDGNTYVARYDDEIAYVDHHVGALLDGVAQLVDIDRTLVLLTADHGESMMEHERWFTHGYHVYDEITRVPMLLRGPGVESGRYDTPVSGLDVAATILRFAGGDLPPGAGDTDLRRPSSLASDRVVLMEASHKDQQWRAAVSGSSKVVIAVKGPQRRIAERRLFDLDDDPGELSARPPADDDALLAELEELAREDPDPAGIPARYAQGIKLESPKVAPDVSEEALEALRALGYTR